MHSANFCQKYYWAQSSRIRRWSRLLGSCRLVLKTEAKATDLSGRYLHCQYLRYFHFEDFMSDLYLFTSYYRLLRLLLLDRQNLHYRLCGKFSCFPHPWQTTSCTQETNQQTPKRKYIVKQIDLNLFTYKQTVSINHCLKCLILCTSKAGLCELLSLLC